MNRKLNCCFSTPHEHLCFRLEAWKTGNNPYCTHVKMTEDVDGTTLGVGLSCNPCSGGPAPLRTKPWINITEEDLKCNGGAQKFRNFCHKVVSWCQVSGVVLWGHEVRVQRADMQL